MLIPPLNDLPTMSGPRGEYRLGPDCPRREHGRFDQARSTYTRAGSILPLEAYTSVKLLRTNPPEKPSHCRSSTADSPGECRGRIPL